MIGTLSSPHRKRGADIFLAHSAVPLETVSTPFKAARTNVSREPVRRPAVIAEISDRNGATYSIVDDFQGTEEEGAPLDDQADFHSVSSSPISSLSSWTEEESTESEIPEQPTAALRTWRELDVADPHQPQNGGKKLISAHI
jgi:hypothetical protein